MSKIKKFLVYFASIIFIVLPVLPILNLQNVYDWVKLHGYKPPVAVANISKATTMNSYGQKIFYVNHPQLIGNKVTFNEDCRDNEQSIVLGCFESGKGIFIYDVQDPRLSGVHEVTAAHEMLHAAYERLSSKEKTKVDKLIQQTYKSLTDERILKTIKSYQDKDPESVPSEMHSIFGTEVRNLPKELEDYYKKYFNNREAIVALSEKYEQEFTRREDLVKQYDAQLENLRSTIESNRISIDQQIEQIKQDKAAMDQLLSQKNYNAYNLRVDGYNQKVNSVESLIAQTNSLINQYNDILNSRNSIALEQQELIQAIDSRVSSAKSQ